MKRVAPWLFAALAGGCAAHAQPSVPRGRPDATARVVLSIVGTNDVHGHIERLPMLAGYVANLRAARARDDGGVVLIDAGDMFQGTLESNGVEGSVVIAAYNRMGYAAAAVGNHEFDYGVAGPTTFPHDRTEDPRGALRSRAREAHFPLLDANLVDATTRQHVTWDNMPASTLITVSGVRVGIVGVTTLATPTLTSPQLFRGLAMAPLAETIAHEAATLRAHGADIVVAAAHAGGDCHQLAHPDDLSSCDPTAEIFQVARALPPGSVDVIVAGHTHQGVAQRVAGIPIIESFALARAFGRVDLTFDRTTRHLIDAQLFAPHDVCAQGHPETGCDGGNYEGARVVADPVIASLVAAASEAARAQREAPVGVRIEPAMHRAYTEESSLGNFVADMMRAALPTSDVAITNGGGIRANLEVGVLHYGALYETLPFDNRLVLIHVTGAALRRTIRGNLERGNSIIAVSGLHVNAVCAGPTLEVALMRDDGRPVRDDEVLAVATSDFLAGGGDGFFERQPEEPHDAGVLRDEVVRVLGQRGGVIRGDDTAWFDPAHRRISLPMPRPVHCP